MFWNMVSQNYLPQQMSQPSAGTGMGTGMGTPMHNGDWRAGMNAPQGVAGAGMGVGGAMPQPMPAPSQTGQVPGGTGESAPVPYNGALSRVAYYDPTANMAARPTMQFVGNQTPANQTAQRNMQGALSRFRNFHNYRSEDSYRQPDRNASMRALRDNSQRNLPSRLNSSTGSNDMYEAMLRQLLMGG